MSDEPKCTCDSVDLFRFGCKCQWIKNKKQPTIGAGVVSVPVDIKPVELKNPPDFTSIDKAYFGKIITPVEFKIEDGKLYAKDEESDEWVECEPEEVTAGVK